MVTSMTARYRYFSQPDADGHGVGTGNQRTGVPDRVPTDAWVEMADIVGIILVCLFLDGLDRKASILDALSARAPSSPP